jgi:hypothetical protein
MNKPWLEEAAQRGDVIRAISDPNIPINIQNGSNLSFFGREHNLLTTPINQGGLGYTYNPLLYIYTP